MTFPFAAVLFDLDGTLADSLGDLADAVNYALGLNGLPPHPEAAYRQMVGEGVEQLIRRALPEGRDPLLLKVLSEFRGRYATRYAVRTRPYPGIPELLTALPGLGCKMAVLSNKREDFTRALVATLFPQTCFDLVRGERAFVPRKPDPTAALEMARQLAVPPSRIAFVGDTAIDMDTAHAAGMFPVGVLWGFRPREELVTHGARALLAHPRELLEVTG